MAQDESSDPDKWDFDIAVCKFQEFLEKHCDYSSKLVWVTPQDVLVTGKKYVHVKVPAPGGNAGIARRTYERGIATGLGVLLTTVCEIGDSTCCHVWYPKNKEDVPQGIWPRNGKVKLTAKIESSRVIGKPVKSRIRWAILNLIYRDRQNLKDFLFRG